jgi:hypothetical protein
MLHILAQLKSGFAFLFQNSLRAVNMVTEIYNLMGHLDRLYGLVVGVPGYRSKHRH